MVNQILHRMGIPMLSKIIADTITIYRLSSVKTLQYLTPINTYNFSIIMDQLPSDTNLRLGEHNEK